MRARDRDDPGADWGVEHGLVGIDQTKRIIGHILGGEHRYYPGML